MLPAFAFPPASAAARWLARLIPGGRPRTRLDGLRIGLIGDGAAACPQLVQMACAMGARLEAGPPDARPRPAAQRPDAVVVGWSPVPGHGRAEWEQVARMRLDNPRLVVILIDLSRGTLFLPEHDLHLPARAPRRAVAGVLADLRRLVRERALAAETRAAGAAVPLFRKRAATSRAFRETARAA